MRLKEKQQAIALRKLGKSYNEILSHFPYLSKSTLSRWLSNLQLTKDEKNKLQQKLKQRISHGLIRASQTIRNNKIKRIKKIYCSAKKLFYKYKDDPLFISGLILYWAEGAKTTEHIQFMNSDHRLVILMLRWFKKYLGVKQNQVHVRLYMHKIYAHENPEIFWQKITNIPKQQFLKTIFKHTPHKTKRNPDYRGCMRVDAGGVKNFYTIKCWEESFTKTFSLSPSWCNG